MQSPFHNTDAAFDVMFAESVSITHGEDRQTISAAVFADGTDEAITNDALDTERESISIVCKRDDWAFAETVTRGDTVERENGAKYKVVSARRDATMGFVIRARGV